MRRLLAVLLTAALGFAFAAPVVRADDKKTPEQKKAEQKEKDLKKAKEDLEKELKGKKQDPAPASAMLDKLANQFGMEVKDAKDLVNKVIAKKVPWDQANVTCDDKFRSSIDAKTNKVDLKKFKDDFGKWIAEWKETKEAPKDPPKK